MINSDLIYLVILIAFLVIAGIQAFYYIFIYLRLPLFKKNEDKDEPVPVSIVICARNEMENLEKYLPRLLEQDYHEFEVVVVNDCSVDDTEDTLKRYKNLYPRLKTTFIKEDEKFSHGKKLALTVGIKAASYEHLLLTDADCYPATNKWLSQMASHFKGNTSIVLGYGGFIKSPGLLNMLIRFDAAFIALNYLSLALAGIPYMGVGRNLAYKKSLFFANKGFATHLKLNSGDDDLFINEVAQKHSVAVEPFAHTRSEAKKTFAKWVEQKGRHFTTFSHYKGSHKFVLGSEIISRVLFYFLFVALLIIHKYWIIACSVFLFRLIWQVIIFNCTFRRLEEKKLLLISPIFDLIMPFVNFGILMNSIITANKRWR